MVDDRTWKDIYCALCVHNGPDSAIHTTNDSVFKVQVIHAMTTGGRL